MAGDFYATLGVSRTATADEIHQAYRRLARQYHPDLNPNNEDAKKKFQEIQQAYETLKDPKKREMFDRYGAAYESMGGGPAGGWRPQPGAGPGGASYEDFDLGDIFGGGHEGAGGFSDLFRQFTRKQPRRGGGGSAGPGGSPSAAGANVEHELQVPFRTSIVGGNAQLSVRRRGGRVETIDVKIPAGITDGKKIRLKGQGEPATGCGSAGDMLITRRVAPHSAYLRQGIGFIMELLCTLN